MITELLFAAVFSTGAIQETDDLKRNMFALEIFLKDQEDYKKYCPNFTWSQPDIEIYKKLQETQLPENCKKQRTDNETK